MVNQLENVNCPFCKSNSSTVWAIENNWSTKRCNDCDFLYVNPRPKEEIRYESVRLGVHKLADNLDITEKRVSKKVKKYKKILQSVFSDVWSNNKPIRWIDIGAGYGELVQAVLQLAHKESKVYGLEPMVHKVYVARTLGLNIISGFIDHDTPKCEYASIINLFSHIYDFDAFLNQVNDILIDGGELLLVTGDMTDVQDRDQFPGELGLPDHVTFASEKHLVGFLIRNGFEIKFIDRRRVDGFMFSIKNLVKRLIGRSSFISIPFRSPYREIRIRAKKCL